MMITAGIIDYEKSPCGDCGLLSMCRLVYQLEGIRDPLVDFRIIVDKCGAYKPIEQEQDLGPMAGKVTTYVCLHCRQHFVTAHGLKIHQGKVHKDVGENSEAQGE